MNFKNMAVSISGKQTDLNSHYYAESVSISEQLSELNFASLGSNSINTATAKAPEGTIDVSFYITTGQEIEAITGHYGKTGFIEVQVGPFVASDSLLQSFDIGLDSEGIMKGSMNYQYYGQVTSGSAPSAPAPTTILPAHGAASSLELSSMGVSSAIDVSYSFSQSYNVGFSLGSSAPARVTFESLTKTLGINTQAQDVNFGKSNLTGTSGICHNQDGEDGFSIKSGIINLKNLCNESVATLSVTGYLDSRDLSAGPNENVQQSLTLLEVSAEGDC